MHLKIDLSVFGHFILLSKMIGNALKVLSPKPLGLVFLEIFFPHHSVINIYNNSSVCKAYFYLLLYFICLKYIGTLTSLLCIGNHLYRREMRWYRHNRLLKIDKLKWFHRTTSSSLRRMETLAWECCWEELGHFLVHTYILNNDLELIDGGWEVKLN